jgi:TorA maturation chaperone TorD
MDDTVELQDFIAIMRGRAAFYEFFSLAYRKPADEEFLGLIKQFLPHFQALAEEVDIADIKAGAEGLAKFVEKVDKAESCEDKEELLTLINRCYTSLFYLGLNSVATAESVYLSPERLVKQEPWEAVIKFYYEHKFGMPSSFKETEDHVSMETLFMYFLAENTARELENGDEEKAESFITAQKNFLNDHILRWIPAFCELVLQRKNDNMVFVDSATMLLRGFLAYDKEFLQELTA